MLHIFVRTLEGWTATVAADVDETVGSVKAKLQVRRASRRRDSPPPQSPLHV